MPKLENRLGKINKQALASLQNLMSVSGWRVEGIIEKQKSISSCYTSEICASLLLDAIWKHIVVPN